MNLLIQFLLRLSFGLAAGMAITSSKKVTSGYFRNHLYVTLGLTTLAAMVSYSIPPDAQIFIQQLQTKAFWFCIAAVVLSYMGSVLWLYEQRAWGKACLVLVSLCCLNSAVLNYVTQHDGLYRKPAVSHRYVRYPSPHEDRTDDVIAQTKESNKELEAIDLKQSYLVKLSVISSGLLLGMTMASMLLGHWYLNSPTMELVPLRRLIIAMGIAVGLQAAISALGLWGELTYANEISTQWWLFLLLRWSFGIVGVAVLAWMAWQTLNIPNTQSATGILYVAVIGTFVGETMALLLSAESLFPL